MLFLHFRCLISLLPFDLALTKELMYYGIAVYPLDTMGSHEQGVRVCTSFFKPEQEQLFKERIEAFHQAHQ